MREKQRKYQIDTKENKEFLRELREDLLNSGRQLLLSGRRRHSLEGQKPGNLDHISNDPCVQHRHIFRT